VAMAGGGAGGHRRSPEHHTAPRGNGDPEIGS
jgi:hypothetical protein